MKTLRIGAAALAALATANAAEAQVGAPPLGGGITQPTAGDTTIAQAAAAASSLVRNFNLSGDLFTPIYGILFGTSTMAANCTPSVTSMQSGGLLREQGAREVMVQAAPDVIISAGLDTYNQVMNGNPTQNGGPVDRAVVAQEVAREVISVTGTSRHAAADLATIINLRDQLVEATSRGDNATVRRINRELEPASARFAATIRADLQMPNCRPAAPLVQAAPLAVQSRRTVATADGTPVASHPVETPAPAAGCQAFPTARLTVRPDGSAVISTRPVTGPVASAASPALCANQ